MNPDIQLPRSRLMDAKETAEYLKLDEKTVSRWARRAYIPAHPLGEGKRRFWRFYEHELRAWLSCQSNGADQLVNSSPNETAAIDAWSERMLAEPARVTLHETGNQRSPTLIAEPRPFVQNRSQRYQRGSLSILKHRNTSDTWVFRYYANENGRRVYKRKTIGTIIDLPRRKDAEKAVAQLRIEINEGARSRPITVGELAAHFRSVELPLKACSTRNGYQNILSSCVLPRWSQYSLLSIESVEVELWIRNLKAKNGQPASPATKSKVRNLMSALFSHAIRYGWATRNAITPVRTTSKRQREPDILTPSEFQALLKEVPDRERLMLLLAGTTGLRRGELIGLRWSDLDFEQQLVNVTRSVWHNIDGDTKTPASRKPIPLHPELIQRLKSWRRESPYGGSDDFLFPSIRANGKHPLDPGMILRGYIRPALARLGVNKRIGWHSFRHGFSNLLRKSGVDLKTAQDLLRHASSRITLDIYQQSVTEERRKGQAAVFEALTGK